MITSATGLIIGILAYIGHSYLVAQITRIENKMEIASAEFADMSTGTYTIVIKQRRNPNNT